MGFVFKIYLCSYCFRYRTTMPSKYQRKCPALGSWSTDDLENAFDAIKDGMSLRKAAKEYGIPFSTLRDRLKIRKTVEPKLGKYATFTKEQEEMMVQNLLQLSGMYYGVASLQLRRLAFDFASQNNIKNNFNKKTKLAGKSWFYSFMARHPEISLRKPEPISVARIKAFNKAAVREYFENLKRVYTAHRFDPSHIVNMDETGFSNVQRPGKVLAQKGERHVAKAVSAERGVHVTIICAMCADGSYIPPMFIFPRARKNPFWEKHGPCGALYECSKNGWSTADLFLVWLEHLFKTKRPSVNDPLLLILDNHFSHVSLPAIKFCETHNIVLVTLPPHTSHKTQPLDVVFFGPLKTEYNRQCDLHMNVKKCVALTLHDIVPIFNKAYLKTATMEKAVKGFQVTGIYPYNEDVFTHELLEDKLTNIENVETLFITDEDGNKQPFNVIDITNMVHQSATKKSTRQKRRSEVFSECLSKQPSSNPPKQKQTKLSEYFCIFCHEKYTDPPCEDWIQCIECLEWCHEKCSDAQSTSRGYICDLCRKA